MHRHQLILARLHPRPEKSSQSVALGSRHNMNMQMRHALAHDIIHRHKTALGLHGRRHRPGQMLRIQKERPHQLGRQIRQRPVMLLGNQQHVPRKQRPMIQKRHRDLVFENNLRRHAVRRDFAEQAVRFRLIFRFLLFHRLTNPPAHSPTPAPAKFSPAPYLSKSVFIGGRSSRTT